MKKLNLQLERPAFDWARAEAARLNVDLSGLVTKFLLETCPPDFRTRRRIARKRQRPRRFSKVKSLALIRTMENEKIGL